MWNSSKKLYSLFFFVFTCIGIGYFAFCEDANKEKKKEDPKEIAKLIEKLASPKPQETIENSVIGKSVKVLYPQGTRKETEKRVHETWDEIIAEGPSAFPYLFEHFDDNRFSFNNQMGNSGLSFDLTVGLVCMDIISSQIVPFGTSIKLENTSTSITERPSYFNKYLIMKKVALEWLKIHQNESLHDMQIDALEWTIAEEKKFDNPKYDDDLKYLIEVLENLKKSNRALPPCNKFYSERNIEVQFKY
jgi:hypothetical protein